MVLGPRFGESEMSIVHEIPMHPSAEYGDASVEEWLKSVMSRTKHLVLLPTGQHVYYPGNILWIQEAWGYRQTSIGGGQKNRHTTIEYQLDSVRCTYERPDDKGIPTQRGQNENEDDLDYGEYLSNWWGAWQQPSTMPRWACRTTLEITKVAVVSNGDRFVWQVEFIRRENTR